MPEYTYLDFERDADDNQAVGSALVTRFPEGWAGDKVNGSMAAVASAVRTTGDRALFAPVDDDGNPVSQQAGTLALQDADNVTFTGGVIDGLRGSVPVGTVIFYGKSWETYVANYNTLLNQGWVICDGRVVTNPFTGALVTLPNFIGRYPFGASTDALIAPGNFNQPSTGAGSHAHGAATGVAGAHSHGGGTGSLVLTTANMPSSVLTNVEVGGSGGNVGLGGAVLGQERAGTNTGHNHSIAADGNHQHAISEDGSHTHSTFIQPPSIYLIPLMRAF